MMKRLLLAIAIAATVAAGGCHDRDSFKATSSGAQSSASSPDAPPQSTPPSSQPAPTLASIEILAGSGTVWKPHSEGDGNLVVLLPASSAADPVAVNNELGRFVGRTNGNRPTYRFGRPGGAYPPGSILLIGSLQVVVPDPGRRYD